MSLSRFRQDRTLAHVVPLVAFMLVGGGLIAITGSLDGLFRDHVYLSWWRRFPEHWIYPFQTLLAGVLLVFWWRHYELRWEPRKFLLGALLGVVGIGLWILPTQLYDWWGMKEAEPGGWKQALGILPRREGFDPSIFESPAAWWTATIFRMLRAVIVVSLVEELLWRGFLMRFLLNPDGDYWAKPFGVASWRSYLVVTVLVVFIHGPADWAAAFVWGNLMYGCAVWTRSLGACVVMHAVANFLLGWYALSFGKYGLW